MGAKSFDAAAALDFLKSFECEYLYLAGDIIDGWKLRKRWYWTENCMRVLDELMRKKSMGTQIIYLPGNHDDELRRLSPFEKHRFYRHFGISLRERVVHRTADGRRFVVLHGDQFDRKILRGRLSRWSDRLYDGFLDRIGAHKHGPRISIDGHIKPFSLAKTLARHGQRALHLLNNFEAAVYRAVKDRQAHGLICGHTHIPVIKSVRGVIYANCGSWLRYGHTALVETLHDGRLRLIDWPASYEQPALFDPVFEIGPANYKIVPDSLAFRPQSETLVAFIKQLWPVRDIEHPLTLQVPVRPQALTTRMGWPAAPNLNKTLEIC